MQVKVHWERVLVVFVVVHMQLHTLPFHTDIGYPLRTRGSSTSIVGAQVAGNHDVDEPSQTIVVFWSNLRRLRQYQSLLAGRSSRYDAQRVRHDSDRERRGQLVENASWRRPRGAGQRRKRSFGDADTPCWMKPDIRVY